MAERIQLNAGDIFPWGFHIFDKWMTLKENKTGTGKYFEDNLLKKIAVYGYGALGKHLVEDLHTSGIEIAYIIDRNAANLNCKYNIPIKSPEEDLSSVDGVVITPVMYYEIKADLDKKYREYTNMISLEDVVDYCYESLKQ